MDAAYRSILAQFLHEYSHDNSVLDKFSFMMYDPRAGSGQLTATMGEAANLLRTCALAHGQLCLVVDGLDEVSDPEDLCKNLRTLVATTRITLLCL